MPRDASNIETEIKLRVGSPDAARTMLAQHRFTESRPRVFESNALYDTPGQTLRGRGELLRIRRSGDTRILTFKSGDIAGRHKRREELETTVADAAVIEAVLQRLGLRLTFRYDKYRTEYQRDSEPGVVTLDETPIGTFLELEGDGGWIDRTAKELGFKESDYILASYGALYLDYCNRNGLEPTHMIFQ